MDDFQLQQHREELLMLRKRLTIILATAAMLCVMVVGVLVATDPMVLLGRCTMAAFGFGMIGYVVGTVIAIAGVTPGASKDAVEEHESQVVQVDGQQLSIITCRVPVLDVQPGMRTSEDVLDPGSQQSAVLLNARTVLQSSDIERLKKLRVPTIPVEGLQYEVK